MFLSSTHQELESRLWGSILSKTTAGRIINSQLKKRMERAEKSESKSTQQESSDIWAHRQKDMKREKSSVKTQKDVSCLFPIPNKQMENKNKQTKQTPQNYKNKNKK